MFSRDQLEFDLQNLTVTNKYDTKKYFYFTKYRNSMHIMEISHRHSQERFVFLELLAFLRQ